MGAWVRDLQSSHPMLTKDALQQSCSSLDKSFRVKGLEKLLSAYPDQTVGALNAWRNNISPFAIRTDTPIIDDHTGIMRRIVAFWNLVSDGWQQVWGPHIHHGYYEDGGNITPLEAQEKLIEKLAIIAKIEHGESILDAGSSIGGGSRYLAKNYDARVEGIALGPVQVRLAVEESDRAGVSNGNFRKKDAHSLSIFPDKSFDLVWSLESCEQFYDKALFIRQAHRVLKKNGRLIIATRCSDRDEYEGREARAYRKVCKAFDLPYMPSPDYYRHTIESSGFHLAAAEDWTSYVQRSWDIGISWVGDAYSFVRIPLTVGLKGLKVTRRIRLMRQAYRKNRVKYGVFLGIK